MFRLLPSTTLLKQTTWTSLFLGGVFFAKAQASLKLKDKVQDIRKYLPTELREHRRLVSVLLYLRDLEWNWICMNLFGANIGCSNPCTSLLLAPSPCSWPQPLVFYKSFWAWWMFMVCEMSQATGIYCNDFWPCCAGPGFCLRLAPAWGLLQILRNPLPVGHCLEMLFVFFYVVWGWFSLVPMPS